MIAITELLCVVDENDNIIGFDKRTKVHETGRWHRGIYIIVTNDKDEIILQLRSPNKRKYPNKYDCSVSEHVIGKESYDDAAKRGLEEELGIRDVKLKRLLKFRIASVNNEKMILVLFKAKFSGKIRPDKEEISEAIYVAKKDIPEFIKMNRDRFLPLSIEILRWYLGMPSEIKEM